MKKILSLLTTVFMITAISHEAFSLDLDTARHKKQVKETEDGLLEAVDKSAEVQSLVTDINKKRESFYKDISEKTGAPIAEVKKKAAEKIKNEAKSH